MTPITPAGVAALQSAVSAAEGARARGDAPFGAVVVLDGVVVSLESNAVVSSGDPTAHAEVCAIREACRSLGRTSLAGAVLYSSCEPCLMCAAAAVWAGIDSVVYAAPIEAVTLFPIADLFPAGSLDWERLPLARTLVPVPGALSLVR
ncbi:nucleoside deaminase [Herbiconiux moechotypicola]|uniref:CMP/dCMP-type deaminase domain-containing protein n=1 Tax=Herbiconiux moechotypicola TaxID=637393 RepID=A0ABN3DF97_9MICO|nr:nucleoside deaminase [Herbiconiux moechotypicola]MCS5729397.1 nucleoside deaminase [Herbiconiux moechotypicola]